MPDNDHGGGAHDSDGGGVANMQRLQDSAASLSVKRMSMHSSRSLGSMDLTLIQSYALQLPLRHNGKSSSSIMNILKKAKPQKKYFALHCSGRLVFYKSEDKRECVGTLLLGPNSFVTCNNNEEGKSIMHIGNPGEEHLWLEFDSPETLEQWGLEVRNIVKGKIREIRDYAELVANPEERFDPDASDYEKYYED